ncbi:MAG TPA: hypothetical protein VKG84_14895, partial [Candidatus Acidoferrales bacterium]|nr:hypothetical protein [Candidatus Acidoferrales bacterium]
FGSNSTNPAVPLFCNPGTPCTSLASTDTNWTVVKSDGVTPAPGLPIASETGVPTVLPPWAASAGAPTATTGDWFNAGQPRIWGYIKIEYQDQTSGGNWTDVTQDILSLGTTGRNLSNGSAFDSLAGTVGTPATLATATASCIEPYPNAVLRLQRVTDVPSVSTWGTCGYNTPASGSNGPGSVANNAKITTVASDFIPMMLFDAREALVRDTSAAGTAPSGMTNSQLALSGVMYYVELDVTNLSKWFVGTIGQKGAPPAGTAGYLVYFSDRRSNQPCSPVGNCPSTASASGTRKLGNIGYEDIVNPLSSTGTPNGLTDTGEDLNGANATAPGATPVTMPVDTYGGQPSFEVYPLPTAQKTAPYPMLTDPASGSENCTPGTPAGSNLLCPGGPATTVTKMYKTAGTGAPYQAVSIPEARDNPALFFRRALKLTDAAAYTLGTCGTVGCGLTITSENPVYVEGNFNATGGSCTGSPTVCTYTGTEVPSAILADAVTFLSSNWNDIQSYVSPYDGSSGSTNRSGNTTYYRMAILAGKGLSFPQPSGTAQDFGTDGGVHNFLRYLENWNGTLAYSGSIVSFYFNTQAIGTYKCCFAVYNPPARGYAFDTKFLTPTLLPPRTPTFRDINTLGFTQLILPNQLY